MSGEILEGAVEVLQVNSPKFNQDAATNDKECEKTIP